MPAPESSGFLLMRRAGGVWGIANEAVSGLARDGGGYRLTVGGEVLAADEILGVVTGLRVCPVAPALRRFWPEAPAGTAVHEGVPVVVVDPLRVPAVLRFEVPPCEVSSDEGEEA
jgi:hypothetical protein